MVTSTNRLDTVRAARGAKANSASSAAAVHCARQIGQTSSSPIARRRPRPRAASSTSPLAGVLLEARERGADDAGHAVPGHQPAEPEGGGAQQRGVAGGQRAREPSAPAGQHEEGREQRSVERDEDAVARQRPVAVGVSGERIHR
jgi:hypothetical protein